MPVEPTLPFGKIAETSAKIHTTALTSLLGSHRRAQTSCKHAAICLLPIGGVSQALREKSHGDGIIRVQLREAGIYLGLFLVEGIAKARQFERRLLLALLFQKSRCLAVCGLLLLDQGQLFSIRFGLIFAATAKKD